jgi:hypothetical protein
VSGQSRSGASPSGFRLTAKVAVLESAASWAVRRSLESGYHLATGSQPPTARDHNVPFRRIVAWAAVSAAAVAVANVAVDRFALRREPPGGI